MTALRLNHTTPQSRVRDPVAYSRQEWAAAVAEAQTYAVRGPRTGPVTAYARLEEKTSPVLALAFARGARAALRTDDLLCAGPIALMPSAERWPMFRAAWARGQTVFFLDKGYFGRGFYFRCTANAFQHAGGGFAPPARFASFGIPVQPWRKGGAHILLCPNSPAWFRSHGLTADGWQAGVRKELAARTDRPLIVRWKGDARPLAADLANCWAVVTFTSNAALEAILAGVPAFATGECAANALGSMDLARIEDPPRPEVDERLRVACVLAANQWTLAEYESGQAWTQLREAA